LLDTLGIHCVQLAGAIRSSVTGWPLEVEVFLHGTCDVIHHFFKSCPSTTCGGEVQCLTRALHGRQDEWRHPIIGQDSGQNGEILRRRVSPSRAAPTFWVDTTRVIIVNNWRCESSGGVMVEASQWRCLHLHSL
ncbi:hypothetical protein TNCV_2973791, partial [Trichonephila clavipes]